MYRARRSRSLARSIDYKSEDLASLLMPCVRTCPYRGQRSCGRQKISPIRATTEPFFRGYDRLHVIQPLFDRINLVGLYESQRDGEQLFSDTRDDGHHGTRRFARKAWRSGATDQEQ
jgi:hypothetical protein